MKRTVRIIIATVLLLALLATGVTVYLLRVTGGEGSSALERWIGSQLQGVAASYLNAELSFENPDYQYPLTVVVENIKLTAPDTAQGAGKTLDIIRIGRATLTLAEVPSEGQPLKIERVVLEAPEFHFVCRSAEDISLVGFSDLVKTQGSAETPPPTRADEPAAPVPGVKVTDVFRLRMVHITNGKVHYDPRRADRKVMTLDRINMALNVEPDQEGWYTLSTKLDRAPLGELDILGRYNLNDNIFDFTKLSLTVEFGPEINKALPPQMQAFLTDHDVRGELQFDAKGTIAVTDWRKAKLDGSLRLTEGRFTFGEYQLDVQQLAALASVSDGVARLSQLDVRTLGGSIFANAELKLDDSLDAKVVVDADRLRLEQLVRAPAADASGKSPPADDLSLQGTARLRMNAQAPLGALTTKLAGGGHLRLTSARLFSVPFVNMLENVITSGGTRRDKRRRALSDELLVMFNFKGDRIKVERLDFRSTVVAVRGGGDISLDGWKLDLLVNGGPIEKVQSLLGPVGDLTAILTDRIAKYHVTGKIGEPEVSTIIAEGLFDRLFGK